MNTLVSAGLRGSLARIAHIRPVRPTRQRDLLVRSYAQTDRELGMLTPALATHSPAPRLLAAAWMMLRETLVATNVVDRPVKEAVATAVSLANGCRFCTDLHATTLDTVNQLRERQLAGDCDPAYDHDVRRTVEWARTCGTPTQDEAPFPDDRAAELVGVVIAVHYLNRMVNAFLPDTALVTMVPATTRAGAQRLIGRALLRSARQTHRPGTAVTLLPTVPAPPDLAWAARNPTITTAFGRAYGAIDAGGARSVPEVVRLLVTDELARWDGRTGATSSAWGLHGIAALPAADQPAARLALVTALAPDRIGPSLVNDAHRALSSDQTLVELVSWASLSAAREVGRRAATTVRGRVVPFRRRRPATTVTRA